VNNSLKIILVLAAGAMLLYFGGDWATEKWVNGPKNVKGGQITNLAKAVEDAKQSLEGVRYDAQRMAILESRSLPSKTEVARSLYVAWLSELVKYAELSSPSLNAGEPVNRRGGFKSISFSVRVRGNLEQLTVFLFEFYNAPHLHKIQSLGLTPIPKTDQLDLSIAIDTLVLPFADRQDELSQVRLADTPQRAAERLASATLDAYKPIVERNLFAIADSGTDPADHTVLTGVNYVDGVPEAWFTTRTDGKTLRLRIGDRLIQDGDRIRKSDGEEEPGLTSEIGRVAEMKGSDLVLERDGERWLLTIGETLAQAYALPPEL
jgi:hypothetical protein